VSPAFDDRTASLLYHALGANLEQGLQQFEAVFEAAESGFRLEEIDLLLGILADPTLQARQLQEWHKYYTARKVALLWKADQAEQIAAELQAGAAGSDRFPAALRLRLELLEAQVQVMRGHWSAARSRLNALRRRTADEPPVQLAACEWLAQSRLAQAVCSGGWAEPPTRAGGRLLQALLGVLLLPAYLLILLFLGAARVLPIFWNAAVRFGSNYSNWPVFLASIEAYQAAVQALTLVEESRSDRRLRLELLRAEILRFVGNTALALKIYASLREEYRDSSDPYLKARLDLELARIRVRRAEPGPDLSTRIEQDRGVFEQFHDRHSAALADMLLGDLALQAESSSAALDRWGAAIRAFRELGDLSGSAEVLDRCYRSLGRNPSPEYRTRLEGSILETGAQAFSLRLPNRFFQALQAAAWIAPLVGVLGLFAGIAAYLASHERSEYRLLAARILSGEGLIIGGAFILVLMALVLLLGLLGLLSTLRVAATRLDWFVLDGQILTHRSTAEEERSIDLSRCSKIIQVDRALWRTPTDALSYACLESLDGEKMVIPGNTSWYRYLLGTLVARSPGRRRQYRLNFYGGAVFLLIGSIFPLMFVLIDLSFRPWLSVTAHANLVTLSQLAVFSLILWITDRWLLHFVSVTHATGSPIRFYAITGSMALCLLVAGVLGQGIFFPFNTLILAWGLTLLVALAWSRIPTIKSRTARWLAGMASILAAAAGVAAILYFLVPLLLYTQAYVYAGAIQKLEPSQPDYSIQRSDFFEKMGRRAGQILQLDPGYTQAYGLLGFAYQAQGDLSGSLEAYTKYYQRSGSTDILDCRAFIYYQMGNQSQARQDYQVYLAGKTVPASPDYCVRYFPEMKGVLGQP
jgi:hypothetical protein